MKLVRTRRSEKSLSSRFKNKLLHCDCAQVMEKSPVGK